MVGLGGRHVLLTGGSRGIGPFVATALARRGAHVALTARSAEGLRRTAEALEGLGVRTVTVPADLADPAGRRELVDRVLAAFGAIDVLVNNAGVETEGAFLGVPWQALAETVEVNLVAPMALTHLLLPHMLERGSGHVVTIASLGAKAPAPYSAAYCGAKAGIAALMAALRLELAGSGVRFSTVFPGYVTEAGMFARFGLTPPWRIGSCTPGEVAEAVVGAIERERLEVVVNSRPLRPALMLKELSPALGDWLMRRFGAVAFQRRKVGLP